MHDVKIDVPSQCVRTRQFANCCSLLRWTRNSTGTNEPKLLPFPHRLQLIFVGHMVIACPNTLGVLVLRVSKAA